MTVKACVVGGTGCSLLCLSTRARSDTSAHRMQEGGARSEECRRGCASLVFMLLLLPPPLLPRTFLGASGTSCVPREGSHSSACRCPAAAAACDFGLAMLHPTLRARHLSHGPRRPPSLTRPRARARLLLLPPLHSRTAAAPFTPSTPFSARAPAAAMASDEQPQWAAARVRQTFLDYFKERGHTFGRSGGMGDSISDSTSDCMSHSTSRTPPESSPN